MWSLVQLESMRKSLDSALTLRDMMTCPACGCSQVLDRLALVLRSFVGPCWVETFSITVPGGSPPIANGVTKRLAVRAVYSLVHWTTIPLDCLANHVYERLQMRWSEEHKSENNSPAERVHVKL